MSLYEVPVVKGKTNHKARVFHSIKTLVKTDIQNNSNLNIYFQFIGITHSTSTILFCLPFLVHDKFFISYVLNIETLK